MSMVLLIADRVSVFLEGELNAGTASLFVRACLHVGVDTLRLRQANTAS
jgi:hypothetical protein